MKNKKIVVVGGGITGLEACYRLEMLGYTPVLIEKAFALGGLTRSINQGDHIFDYTGHLLHLAKHTSPAALLELSGEDHCWHRINRNAKCLHEGKMIDAPFQYNIL